VIQELDSETGFKELFSIAVPEACLGLDFEKRFQRLIRESGLWIDSFHSEYRRPG
jgi:hypothetical protein